MDTKLYINKFAIKQNVEFIASKLGGIDKIIAMVKANAYGIGSNLISKYLENLGIEYFGVANTYEGKNLRQNKITSNIIVTSQILDEDFKDVIDYNLEVSMSNVDIAKRLNEYAKYNNVFVNIHIAVDTSMLRLGFIERNIYDNVKEISKLSNIHIKGIYTHLSVADTNKDKTNRSLQLFDSIVNKLKSQGYSFEMIHALNSAGSLEYSNKNYTHTPVGIMLYGLLPSKDLSKKYGDRIKDVLMLKTKIARIENINKELPVSYGGNYIAKPDQRIATINIGYADFLPRQCSNKYFVYVNNIPCPIIGNICMDMCMIDVTNVLDLNVGDEVIVFKSKEDIERIAEISNTISYEIISKINARVDRVLI